MRGLIDALEGVVVDGLSAMAPGAVRLTRPWAAVLKECDGYESAFGSGIAALFFPSPSDVTRKAGRPSSAEAETTRVSMDPDDLSTAPCRGSASCASLSSPALNAFEADEAASCFALGTAASKPAMALARGGCCPAGDCGTPVIGVLYVAVSSVLPRVAVVRATDGSGRLSIVMSVMVALLSRCALDCRV